MTGFAVFVRSLKPRPRGSEELVRKSWNCTSTELPRAHVIPNPDAVNRDEESAFKESHSLFPARHRIKECAPMSAWRSRKAAASRCVEARGRVNRTLQPL